MNDLEFNDSLDELFDDGLSADKLPPELASLKDRPAKMNEMLNELRSMDARRKKDGIDPKKNPAQLPKTAMEERGVELLAPLAQVKCPDNPDNPAVRDDPTEPVSAADVHRLPKNASSKLFDKQAFVYDEEQDCYHCPNGRTLSRKGTENQARAGGDTVLTIIYQCDDCSDCSIASHCRKNVDARTGRKPREVFG